MWSDAEGRAAHPPFFCPQLLEQSSQSPIEGPQQEQGGAWYPKTGMGSSKLRGQIAEGVALSREVQWTPGRGMRSVGKGKELTGDRTNLSGRHEAAW